MFLIPLMSVAATKSIHIILYCNFTVIIYFVFHRSLPKARVVYCSATGVTDVKNMAFMERMGLWGINSAFNTYTDFLDTIQKKGLGM